MKFNIEHIVGHRGAKLDAPENSLGGFQYLRSLGVHKVELDVQLTRDSHVVVFHDKTLDRLCNMTGEIHDYDLKALQQFNCAANFQDWHQAEPIPTLEQVLSEWPDLKHIQIEVKINNQDRTSIEILLEKINQLIQKYRLEDIAIITSKHTNVLRSSINNKICSQGLVCEPRTSRNNLCELAQALTCDYLAIHYSLIDPNLLSEAKQKKIKLSAWTVNDPNIARSLVEINHLDSVITDRVRDTIRFTSSVL